jgi:hypothetical protein
VPAYVTGEIEVQLDWQLGRLVAGRVFDADIGTPFFTTSRGIIILVALHRTVVKLMSAHRMIVEAKIGIPPLSGKYLAGQSN